MFKVLRHSRKKQRAKTACGWLGVRLELRRTCRLDAAKPLSSGVDILRLTAASEKLLACETKGSAVVS